MTEPITEQPPESRLRRWYRSFYGGVEAMDISGYEHLAHRIDHLEKRMQRLEALRAPPPSDHDSGD